MKISSGKALNRYYSSRHTPYAVTLVQITARHRWMPMRTSRRGEVTSPNGLGDPTPTHSTGIETVLLTHVEHSRNGDVLHIIPH